MLNRSSFMCNEISKVPDRGAVFDRHCIMIRCPYHKDGMERTPSFKINLDGSRYEVGSCYCYACKIRMNWNELATKLGLATFKSSDVTHGTSEHFSFASYENSLPNLKDLLPWPSTQYWRFIPPETITEYDGRLEFVRREVMLYLPVYIRSKYVGGIHCSVDITQEEKERGKKAYINTDGEWSAASVFGFNQARDKTGPLIVVEGPRDTLKVASFGGRVVGLLGAAVTKQKIALIETLDPPAVYCATDPDEAGEIAYKKLKAELPMMPLYRIRFPEGKDPANLTKKSFRKIKEVMHTDGYL